jgi:uncharacterized damage-inducible protein DinB
MRWQDLLIGEFASIQQILERALDGMTQEELKQQPHPNSNNIGYLTWHITRSLDAMISRLMGEEQLWIKDKWYEKFGRAARPGDTGRTNTPEEIAAFNPPDASTILDYHLAVQALSNQYINGLSETDLDREVKGPLPSVAARLNGMVSANLQHAGHIVHLRDLIKGTV